MDGRPICHFFFCVLKERVRMDGAFNILPLELLLLIKVSINLFVLVCMGRKSSVFLNYN